MGPDPAPTIAVAVAAAAVAAAAGGTAHSALTIEETSKNLTTTTLGLRFGTEVGDDEGGNLRLRSMAGWRRSFGDIEPEAQASLAGGDRFTITGSPIEENSFIAEFGIGADLAHNVEVSATYRGQFSEASQAHSLNASLIGRF
ncbi:MAG: autotransporter outer membrane beta-barrel domain-containing protein [Rhizobiaceae bacterium]